MLLGSPALLLAQRHASRHAMLAPAEALDDGGVIGAGRCSGGPAEARRVEKIKRHPPVPQGLPLRPSLAVPRTIYRLNASTSDIGRHRIRQLLEPADIASTSRRHGLGSAFLTDAASAILHSCFTSAAYSEDEGRH